MLTRQPLLNARYCKSTHQWIHNPSLPPSSPPPPLPASSPFPLLVPSHHPALLPSPFPLPTAPLPHLQRLSRASCCIQPNRVEFPCRLTAPLHHPHELVNSLVVHIVNPPPRLIRHPRKAGQHARCLALQPRRLLPRLPSLGGLLGEDCYGVSGGRAKIRDKTRRKEGKGEEEEAMDKIKDEHEHKREDKDDEEEEYEDEDEGSFWWRAYRWG
eukprot:627448-Hanusia_phi.AAC.2